MILFPVGAELEEMIEKANAFLDFFLSHHMKKLATACREKDPHWNRDEEIVHDL